MLVCAFSRAFAHETAGAARTRSSLRPLLSRANAFSKTRARRAARTRRHVHQRLCEPTGRANARPMTGSAKQSISRHQERMDCFARARNDAEGLGATTDIH